MLFSKRKAARDRRPGGLADVVPTQETSVPFSRKPNPAENSLPASLRNKAAGPLLAANFMLQSNI
jgi:hypothetical protein